VSIPKREEIGKIIHNTIACPITPEWYHPTDVTCLHFVFH